MNKHTANAIQARINAGQTEFTIGAYRYICHYDHPEFGPFVLRYAMNGGGEPFHVGNIFAGDFVPADMPIRRDQYELVERIAKAHDWEACRDDLDSLMDLLGLGGEWQLQTVTHLRPSFARPAKKSALN